MTHTHREFFDCALQHLHFARQVLSVEISEYPAPTSGCDAQFNHLLSERQKTAESVAALKTLPFIATPRTPDQAGGVESR